MKGLSNAGAADRLRFGPVPSVIIIIHASPISEMHHSMACIVGTDAVKSRCCRVHIWDGERLERQSRRGI